MRRTEILMFNGMDELDVVAPCEVLVSAGFDVELVTMEPCQGVTGAHGMTLTPAGVLGSRPDLLIRPSPTGPHSMTYANPGRTSVQTRASSTTATFSPVGV
jgi:putative intracellular protease/amidase